jgi:citrate/tricarballylate utilization protein
VLLGTAGGVLLAAGTAGALLHRRRRDAALTHETAARLDRSLLVLLLLTAVTGLALLALRHERVMGIALLVHLGVVAALFVTLPYGKLVHGVYRGIALLHYRRARGSG